MTGSGTAVDPYVIYDVNDLQDIALNLDAYYILGGNIDASITSGWNAGAGFEPIGQHPTHFAGNFDGKGYVISNLFIDRPTEYYVGLFGETENSVEIKNVGIVNCNITGSRCTGALVGYNGDGVNVSAISNCYSSGAVGADGLAWLGCLGGLVGVNRGLSTITDCYSTATILVDQSGFNRDTNEIGGLVGLNDGPITRCYATGNVTVIGRIGRDLQYVGGFVGDNSNGEITRSYATGNVLINDGSLALDTVLGFGGFCGLNSFASITDCYARGDVSVKAGVGLATMVGGFAGGNGDDIDNCYSTGLITTTGMSDVGGFVGDNYGSGTVTDCFWDITTSGMVVSDGGTGEITPLMQDVNTFQNAGWAIQRIWNVLSYCNGGYPCLIGVNICCAATPVQTDLGENKVVLEAIRNLEMVYGARFYIDKSGNAVWESRHHRNA